MIKKQQVWWRVRVSVLTLIGALGWDQAPAYAILYIHNFNGSSWAVFTTAMGTEAAMAGLAADGYALSVGVSSGLAVGSPTFGGLGINDSVDSKLFDWAGTGGLGPPSASSDDRVSYRLVQSYQNSTVTFEGINGQGNMMANNASWAAQLTITGADNMFSFPNNTIALAYRIVAAQPPQPGPITSEQLNSFDNSASSGLFTSQESLDLWTSASGLTFYDNGTANAQAAAQATGTGWVYEASYVDNGFGSESVGLKYFYNTGLTVAASEYAWTKTSGGGWTKDIGAGVASLRVAGNAYVPSLTVPALSLPGTLVLAISLLGAALFASLKRRRSKTRLRPMPC